MLCDHSILLSRTVAAVMRCDWVDLQHDLQAREYITLRLTVSQSVSMSWYRAPLWDLRPDITCPRSKLLYDWQSVSMSWYRAPLWDLRPDIISCRSVAVWNLWSWFCGAPSLTRGRVCNLQCNHSMVRAAQNPKPYFTVSPETPPNMEGQVPVFISPRNRVAQLYSRALGSP
jgi:hypothetical protein